MERVRLNLFNDSSSVEYEAYLFEQSLRGSNNTQNIHAVRRALMQIIRDNLTPRQKEIILAYTSGENMPAIAARLGVCKSTVSRTYNRALRKVQKYAKPLEPFLRHRVDDE